MVLTSCVPTSDAMAHPEAMQGLTFQQPPSCYSYPWKYNHPVLRTIFLFLLIIYIQISTPAYIFKTHPSKNRLNHLLFSNIFCFFKKNQENHMTTTFQQETPTSFGPGPVGTSQVSPLACCHWARLALANFFFTFFLAKKWCPLP